MVLRKTTPGTPGTGTATTAYEIELARWGIQAGLPTKRIEVIGGVNVNCYADADYAKAYNNIIGFNNAFAWAKSQNYTQVKVPFGSYSVCYSHISDNDKENMLVIDFDNFSLDFNASTFKVMFDSVKRSPYDKILSGATWITNTNPVYNFAGVFMAVRDCNYTEVKNGKVIGDKIDRDFTDPAEKGNNDSYGITSGGGCRYINIEGNDVSLFMGDGITMSSSKNNVGLKWGYDLAWVSGDLDSNGAVIASTSHCYSSFVSVDSSTPHFWQGSGSSQGLSYLGSRRITAYMYDINQVYLTKQTVLILREFTTTKLTKFVRFVVEESTPDPNGWVMLLVRGLYGSFITFQNNYIHHNHRGGSSPGVNDMLIANNFYQNNGEWYDYDNDLIGFQTSATRYHINMEDAQGYNMRVIGNRFEGGRIGIAARGYDWIIKDNWFKNCSCVLYRLQYATVKDNYFEGSESGFETFSYNTSWNAYQDYIRYWDIEGNVIEGSFFVYGNAVIKNISNNTIYGQVMMECDVNSFRNNRFKVDGDIGYADVLSLKTVSKIYGCIFIKSVQRNASKNHLQLENCILYDCSISNLKVRGVNITLKDTVISDSGFDVSDGELKFDGCKLSFGSTLLLSNNYPVTPDNSAIINVINNTNPVLVEFKNSSITSSSDQTIFGSYSNAVTNAKLRLDNTKITRQVNNKLGLGVFGNVLDFTNSTISSDVAIPIYTPNAAYVHRFEDCTFTNVSFTDKTSDIKYSQQDIGLIARPLSGSGAPSTVPQKLGQEYYDTTGKRLYKAFGTATASDWVVMN